MSSKASAASTDDGRRVLVTGCLGGVGHALSCRLLEAGWRVSGLDLAGASRRRIPDGMAMHHRLDLGDTGAMSALGDIAAAHDGIIHLAGVSRVGYARKDPLGAIRANIVGTANLLEAIRTAPKPPWLLFASSQEVKVTAHGAFSLTNMYGLTKSVSELLAHRYASDYGMRIAVARIAGIYGDVADYPDKVPIVLVDAALAERPLRVARVSRLMDYVHIDAACAMLIEGIERLRKAAPGTHAVFEVVSGQRVTLAGVARLIRRLAHSKSQITSFEMPKDEDAPVARWEIPYPGPILEIELGRLIKAVKSRLQFPPIGPAS